ncbi:MAG: endo-1,4-beta-xylanase [Clostridiaceae bacterium]|nr:endo-1,4-beta-xylanase [Clostridiaceae bacterium]
MKRTSVIGIWILVLLLLFTSCTGENAGMPEMSDQAAAAPETGGTEDTGETEKPTPDAEPAQAPYLPGWDEEVPSLCETYDGVFRVGAAVNTAQLREGTDFYRLITRHYNTFVTENEMKPMYLNPSEGTFCFDAADRFVEFGEENDVLLRGHTLVWHSQAPDWWFLGEDGGRAESEQLLARLEEYITTVVSRYKGRIHTWDVVNEAVSDSNGGLRRDSESSQYASIIGDLDGDGKDTDYIEKAFYWADAADPDAQLILNDYSLESDVNKLNAFYKLAKELLEKGVPIDGAGIQAHIQIGYPSIAVFEMAIEKLAELKEISPDFTVQITELDVSIFDWGDQSTEKELTPELQTKLAERYADLFEMFRRQAEKGNLDMVVTWGVYDGRSWLDNYPVSGRTNAPLLFDRQMYTKPAFWGVIDRALIPDAVAEMP